ncbi:MAG TPA: phosphatase PAP2 family protein [Vicinamibacterales bacterium]
MIALRWEWVALGYVTYLTVVALADSRFRRARGPTLVAAFTGWTVWAIAGHASRTPLLDVLVPMPILLAGYWLSGLFFVRPMTGVERWLLHVDEWSSSRWHVSWPRLAREYFELVYVLVYAVVPAGAFALVLGGHAAAVPRFWAVVLLSEFASYGMLPWLQTRPPRAIECTSRPPSILRRFNAAVLERGSIRVNTVPSGHSAGASATALAVASAMPIAGAAFLAFAASIVVATVVGRYHYIVDSVLGVLVAFGAYLLVATV